MSAAIALPTMTTMAAPTYAAATYAAPAAAYGTTTMAAPVTYAAPAVTYAAPAAAYGTTTMAAPVTYAAAAAPAVTYAAPAAVYGTTTMAAPVTYAAPSYTPAPVQYASYAAPAQQYASYAAPVPRAASFVAAPVMTTMAPAGQWQAQAQGMPTLGVAMPEITVGPAPSDLTVGIPNSQQIASQKAAYVVALDKQLADGVKTIEKETEIEKQMVKFSADKQIALFQMQVEEQRNEQMALLDEQGTIAVLELKKACVERKIQLDAQAAGLNMDYQMKFVQTELAQKTYAFQQTYAGAENKLLEQYNALVAGANKGTSFAGAAGTAYA